MQWSITSEEEAIAKLPENNMQDGIYWGTVTRQELMPGKKRDDGTVGEDWLKLNIQLDTPFGKMFADAAIFNGGGRMFFKRKHFWESAGKPDKINSLPDEYVGQKVECDCKVESYFSPKYNETKKKYVVVDFVGDSEKEKKAAQSSPTEAFEDKDVPF